MGLLIKAISTLYGWRYGPAKLTDPALGAFLGSEGRSYAGKHVTVDSALQVATAWACIRLNAQTLGSLPAVVYVREGASKRESRDHPLYTLLHDQPNADMSATEFWTALGVSLMTYGNAYAEVYRVLGRVVALTPLRPDFVTVYRANDGRLRYRLNDPDRPRELDEDDVLHVKGLTADGLIGLSPIGQARHTLGLAMAADEVAGKLFSNGMRIGGYMSAPDTLQPAQRAKAREMLREFRGAQAAGLTPVLEAGWKFESITMPPQDAELLATRAFAVEEICRYYGVPPWMIGHTEKSTSWGTGLEQGMQAYYTLTLRPLIKSVEGAIRRRLIPASERARIDVDFNVEGLLRADSAGRASFLQTLIHAGVMTINEARGKEGLPPVEGGDVPVIQSNMLPLNRLGEATTRANLAPTPEPAP